MKFSIMYLAEMINNSTGYSKNMKGYRQLPSGVLSPETEAKVIEDISLYLDGVGFKEHISKVIGE